jgi:hypothetical protein
MIVQTYKLSSCAPNFIKQTLLNIQRQAGSDTTMLRDFDTALWLDR